MDTQSVDTFKQFMEFVKNIDSYADVLDQLKKATEDYNAALNLLTEGKSLKAFSDKLDSVEARLNLERQEFDKSCQAQNDVLDQRVKDLNVREEDLNNRKNYLDDSQKAVDKAATEVSQRSLDLDSKESNLNYQISLNNQVAQDLSNRLALIKQAGA